MNKKASLREKQRPNGRERCTAAIQIPVPPSSVDRERSPWHLPIASSCQSKLPSVSKPHAPFMHFANSPNVHSEHWFRIESKT